ncbi:hypothetical protein [Lentibacillus sediminis]|uniref:hypothetical protein n=1 Tax=Lentibacillus sediminis TaxID=1940529 RepID=UPI0013044659|nr:hypothetical protein [Lentibacillus sediminis]
MMMMIFAYAIYAPITIVEWLAGSGGFPLTAVVLGIGLPLARKNHIKQIRANEGKGAA